MRRTLGTGWFWVDVRESLTAHPLRTLLTAFAIAIGTLTLTLLLGILQALEVRGRDITQEFGANRIRMEVRQGGRTLLTPTHLQTLRASFPQLKFAGMRTDAFPASADQPLPPVHTIDPAYLQLRNLPLREGRWLDPADLHTAHALLDAATATRLGVSPRQPFTFHQTPFLLVGILESPPGLYLPPGRTGPWLSHPDRITEWDAIWIAHPSEVSGPAMAARVEALIRHQHPDATLQTTTPDQLLAATRRLAQTLRTVLGSVVGLCLLLGGATLSTLMTLNVQQRTPEIGLRMSLGAQSRQIFTLFLSEGLLLTFVAGCLGTGVGQLLLPYAARQIDLPHAVTPLTLLLPIGIALFTGVLFSFPPARTAATRSPALALRRATSA